ncbi:MAG: T9SS type A sorting domain-containing protein, partial [Bacteroidales bacterium]
PATASIVAIPEEICISGSSTLSITPSAGYGDATFQWASSADGVTFTDITGANGLSYTTPDITASTYYKWTTTASGNSCLTDTVFIKVNNPQILSTTPGSHCGPGTVELSATANDDYIVKWYDVATGGQPLATGDTFTTPVLTSTTTYYVEATTSSPDSTTVGTGTSTTSYLPFYGLYDYSYGAMLYTADELDISGPITKIKFHVGNSPSSYETDDQIIYMSEVPYTEFADDNLIDTSTLTKVKGPFSYTWDGGGWKEFELDVPFDYSGNNSLLIVWVNNDGTYASGYPSFSYTTKTNTGLYKYQDNSYPSIPGTGTLTENRPNIIVDVKVCASPRVEVIATITEPPAITASVAPNDTICDGEEITLSVTSSEPNYEYTWTYDSQTYSGASFTDSPSASTQYIVNANDPIGGCVNIDTINVTVYPSPSTSVSANPTSIICGESVQLDATGVGYVPTIIVSEDFNETTHSFTAINNSTGGTPEDAAWTLRPDGYSYGSYSPVVFHSNDNTQFIMSNSDDQGSGGTTNTELISPEFSTVGLDSLVLDFYHYFRSGDTAAVDIYDGSQWVNLETYTSTVGSSSSFVHETINLSAYVGLNNVKIRFKYIATWDYYWAIDNVTITGYTPQTISWSSNPAGFTSTIANPVATPITNTTYIATVSNSFGCTDEDSIAITVNPITISVTGETQICVGSSATLTASGAEDYTWSDGIDTYTGASIIVSPIATTTYYVTGTTALGCMNTAEIEITVNPIINKVDDISICNGDSIIWYGNVYNSAGTYYDTISGTIGCDTVAQLNLTILSLPDITASANPSTICSGSPATLTATGGVSYEWSTEDIGSSIIVNPTTETTYTVTGTGANGCENTAEVTVTVNPLPDIIVVADPSTICSGSPATLTATGGVSYEWNTTATGSSITVNPTATTTYTVTGTGANGCENTAEVTVTVNPLPDITASADHSLVCSGSPAILTASGGDTYIWSTDETTTSITVTPTSSTSYTVTGIDANGCENTAKVTVTVIPLPLISASANPGIVCSGSPATLTATGGVSYEWSTTATGSSITVNPTTTTTYTVTGIDGSGCENTATVSVTVNPLPDVQATAIPNEVCIGESTTISASGAITYEWNTGVEVESFTVTPDESTTYTVTGIDANGCENTDEVTVIVNPLPQIMITADNTTICSGQSVTLTASSDIANTTYLWDNGLTDAVITQYPTTNTTYTVTATTPAGCESTANIDITVNPSPTVDLGEDIIQCGGTVTLDAGAGFSSYQWNPPLSSSQTMIVAMSGTYSVTVTNEYDCSSTDDIEVTISNVTVSLAETENGLEATIDPIVSGDYTWYTCDNDEIPGVTEAIYANPTIGECYYVIFTDEYDCEWVSNEVTVTSIANNQIPIANVYPVPTDNEVTIELINNNNADVYLYDMLGQLVNSYKMDDAKLTIDVSRLSGTYMLKVVSADNTINNFRIVVTK